jgi:hypothetical protein
LKKKFTQNSIKVFRAIEEKHVHVFEKKIEKVLIGAKLKKSKVYKANQTHWYEHKQSEIAIGDFLHKRLDAPDDSVRFVLFFSQIVHGQVWILDQDLWIRIHFSLIFHVYTSSIFLPFCILFLF